MFNKGDKVTYINNDHAAHNTTIEKVEDETVTIAPIPKVDVELRHRTFNADTGKGIDGRRIVKGFRKMPMWSRLGGWIEKNCDVSSYHEVKAAIHWFIAVQESEALGDMNRRDVASLFLSGIKPMSDELVNDWLDIHYEAYDFESGFEITEAEADLLLKLNAHFNTSVTEL
ncbi:MAG: hypothetical protein KAS32_13425 [Candidatus Peribacteraceae bacterium]|nr:hypothetical protein [Candidatus Peribacteraceae bacterium]